MDGFLILDKPQGFTSQKVVYILRKLLHVKKVGHTGTLDPLATGALVIALGEATKVIGYLEESEKTYLVEGCLGKSTTTYDAEGEVVEEGDFSQVTAKQLQTQLKNLLGEQLQIPPIFSAIKHQGKPLYKLARKNIEVELKPRKVFFKKLELKKWDPPHFSLEVVCSRGTYIRSLIHDLGKVLGCYAYVSELRRLQTGPFSIEDALTLDQVLADPSQVEKKLWSIEQGLEHLLQLPLMDEQEVEQVRSGIKLSRIDNLLKLNDKIDQVFALSYQEQILALIKPRLENSYSYGRVLNREPIS